MTPRAATLAFFTVASAAVATLGSAVAQDEGAPSYSIEDVTACSQDAMRLCRDKLPAIEAIEACMKEHYEELRPKCKARFKR